MRLDTLHEIERAINTLPPQELAELYTWLDQHRPSKAKSERSEATIFEQGLGLFGSPRDTALLDEVVHMAYAERRRPSHPSAAL